MSSFYSSFSYDVLFTTGQEEILRKFKSFNASLVFSAEIYLWPDKTVKVKVKPAVCTMIHSKITI